MKVINPDFTKLLIIDCMKTKAIYLIGFAAILLFLATSCQKNEQYAFTDFPIIEAYLEPGNEISVSVTRQIPFFDGIEYSADDIDNLDITLKHNNSYYKLIASDSGRYLLNSVGISAGDTLALSFTFDGRNVNTYTYIPTKPEELTQSTTKMYVPRRDTTMGPPSGSMSNPMQITWKNSDESYYMVVVENMETILDPVTDFGDDAPPANRFRKSPTKSASETLRPFDFEYFGMHRIIVYHVLPDYATLYDESSNSSLNLTNPSTDIQNAYGIFTGLNADTLYVNVIESSK